MFEIKANVFSRAAMREGGDVAEDFRGGILHEEMAEVVYDFRFRFPTYGHIYMAVCDLLQEVERGNKRTLQYCGAKARKEIFT